MAAGDEDVLTGRAAVVLALVRAELSDLKDAVQTMSHDVNKLYREGVLRRIVDLEGRLAKIEATRDERAHEGEAFRRKAWVDLALVFAGSVLAFVAGRIGVGK